MGNLLRRHFLDDLFLRDCRIWISANCGQNVPRVSPNKVGFRHASANFVIPTNSGLSPSMTFQRRPQIPFKGPDIVALDTQTKRVHDANQLLSLSVARPGRWQQLLHRGLVVLGVHQVSRAFQIGERSPARHQQTDAQTQPRKQRLHARISTLSIAALISSTFAVHPLASAQVAGLPAPLTAADFHPFDENRAKLGQLLFFDPLLSGNKNIACATCHNPNHGSADGLSLGIGEGGMNVGPARTPGEGANKIRKRIPRNAPALWNLGALGVKHMFWDGRVVHSDVYENGFITPAQEWLPSNLSGLLAAQALFPMTAQFEMAGNPSENEVAGAAHSRVDEVWPIIAKRVRIIPEYADLFIETFDDIDDPLDIGIPHIVNALADFQNSEFQSFDSPFDDYLAGDTSALTDEQTNGLKLFYGKAGCSSCHAGSLLTDQDFHALMLPHFGPGRTRQWDTIVRDVGRMAFSNRLEDAYRFRTPSLRNVALTGPYGHNGAYKTLEGMVRHHLQPRESFAAWTPDNLILPDVPWLAGGDFLAFDDKLERARLMSQLDIEPQNLSDPEVDQLLAFLQSLTGTESIKGRLGRPETVPSGLHVD